MRRRSGFTLVELLVVMAIGATLIAVVAPAAVRRIARGSATASAREVGRALERAARRAATTGRAHVVEVDPRTGRLAVLEERADARSYGITEVVRDSAAPVELPAGTRVSPGRVRLAPGGSARALECDVSGPEGRARVVLDPVAGRARVEAP